MSFQDHFSTSAAEYGRSRPGYPDALFDWIATIAPARGCVWEAGCGSGQATQALARRFDRVHASDPSSAQIAQAPALRNTTFAVEPGERCSLPDVGADAVCVAQALHWFDRAAFFAECERVLRPGGVLVAWGYRDIESPPELAAAVDAFRAVIAGYWPPERKDIDDGYMRFNWSFDRIDAPGFEMAVDWPLQRLLGYFSSFSAVKRHRESTGWDPVARHAGALAKAWGEAGASRRLRWPLFVHARRKPA